MKEPNIIEKLETQPPAEVIEEVLTPEKFPRSGVALVILTFIFAVLLLLIGIAGGYYYSQMQNEMETVEDEADVETDTVTWTDWEGEYLRAKLPEGWELTELTSDYEFQDFGGFTIDEGFGGFIVSDTLGNVLLTVEPNIPIDFDQCSCDSYTQFHDDDPNGYDTQNQPEICEYDELPFVRIEEREYEVVEFLGKHSFRRHAYKYHVDFDEEDDYFTTMCDFFPEVFTFDDNHGNEMTFVTSGLAESSQYLLNSQPGMQTAEESSLLLLDQVLESIEIIPQEDEVMTGEGKSGECTWLTYTNTTHGYTFDYPCDWTVDDSEADYVLGGGELNAQAVVYNGDYQFVIKQWLGGRGGQVCFFDDSTVDPATTELGGGGYYDLGAATTLTSLMTEYNFRRNTDGIIDGSNLLFHICGDRVTSPSAEVIYNALYEWGEISYQTPSSPDSTILDTLDDIFATFETMP